MLVMAGPLVNHPANSHHGSFLDLHHNSLKNSIYYLALLLSLSLVFSVSLIRHSIVAIVIV